MAPAAAETSASPPSPPPAPDPSERRWGKIGCGVLVLAIVGLLVAKIVSSAREGADPTPTSELEGTTVELWTAAQLEDRRGDIAWANACVAASSTGGHECTAFERPDVYPAHQHSGYAWYPRREDDGTEWVHLRWNLPVEARAIVVVETFHPGAVVAVDDLVDAHRQTLGEGERVRLWAGSIDPADGARVTVYRLSETRPIRDVRLVLDTARVTGSNEIDAVGLLPN